MSFVTVAIIKFDKRKNPEDKSETLYLIKKIGKKNSFWEFGNNAIGARYSRDKLDKRFEQEFGLDINDISVEKFASKEYEGKKSPASIACIISLNENGYKKLKTTGEKSEYQWVSSEVFNNENNWVESQQWIIRKTKEELAYQNTDNFVQSFLEKVKQIQRAKEEGNLVIFVGAGISKASEIPLWGELVKKMGEGVDTSETDNEIIPQLYFQEHGETNYYKKIGEILDLDKAEPNHLHREIFQLNPSYIITTNYDELLEKEEKNHLKRYYVVRRDKDLPSSDSANLIVKMHGDFKSKNIVLKEDDYLKYSEEHPLVEILVKSVFASKVVLFLGFSFGDRNLKKIVESVKHILKQSYNPAILFLSEEKGSTENSKVTYYQNRGVSVVEFEPKIGHYLRINEVGNPYQKIKCKENGREAKTYDFLKFIQVYSEENPLVTPNEHVIDKMYRGLIKFQDLPSIPYNYLTKIQPFAYDKKSPATYVHWGSHLKIASDDILKYLGRVEKISGGKIIYKKDGEVEKDGNKNMRLAFIYNKLISSGVNCVQRQHDFREEVHNQLRIENGGKCLCPTCLFSRLELGKAYQSILSIDKNEYWLRLKKSYVKFFFGEYESCYADLKETAGEAYDKGYFHLYFICLYNMKALRYRIKGLFVPQHITKEIQHKIIREIDDISLPATIESLRINQLSKDILHSINCEEMYHTTRRKMEDYLADIEKLYENHKNGMASFTGPNYIENMKFHYTAYADFIHVNRLFDVFYGNFMSLTDLLSRGLFTSIATHDSLKQKIHVIEGYNISYLIKYSTPQTLLNNVLNILDKNESPLKIRDNDIESVVELMLSFIDSNVEISNFMRENIKLNYHIEYSKNRHSMANQRIKNIFDNILTIIYAAAESLKKDSEFHKLVDKILKYVSVCQSEPFSSNHFKCFVKAIAKHGKESQMIPLLKTLLDDNLWSRNYLAIFASEVGRHKNKFIIDNEYLLNQIINRTSGRRSYITRMKEVLPLYKFISKDLKPKFDNFVKENYGDDDLVLITEQGINISKVKAELRKRLVKVCSMEPQIDEFETSKYIGNYGFYDLYKLYVSGKLRLSKKSVEEISSYGNVFSWFISPKTFDYSKFQSEWLELYNSHFFLKFMYGHGSEELKLLVEQELKKNYSDRLSRIYWEYLK